MDTKKYKTCAYVQSIGQYAVYTTPGCPRATMMKGYLLCIKSKCTDCRSYKPKED